MISVAVQAIAPNINVLLVGIFSALLYNHLKALLEASFLVNLIVLTGAFLYINTEKNSNQESSSRECLCWN